MSEIRNLTRNGETFYPLTTSSAVINESTGEGLIIDEVPTAGSDNLVKSGGIDFSIFNANNISIQRRPYYINDNGVWANNATHIVIPVLPNSEVEYTAENQTRCYYTCLKSYSNPVLGEPDFSDYRDLSLYELSRIIFIGAPEEERHNREIEWEGLGSYYRRRLPIKIDLNVFWYPNRFDILFPSIDLTINFWRRLSRRDHKRKPKNIVKWFKEAVGVNDEGNYLCQPLGNFEVNLAALIWWLGDERSGVLLEEMFGFA